MSPNDPRDTLSNEPMGGLQILIVAIMVLMNGLDGFDVLSIAFAAPGIANEWGIDRAALGLVLSMELIGMSVGSITLGGVADKMGRRPTMLGCLLVMSGGMYLATTATSVVTLSIWRVITGLGIGGMLASINAVTAEFASARRKHLCVSLMTIGYPIGAVLGGMVSAELLKQYEWRSVFYFGAAVTALCIPLVYFLVPESVHWLVRKQPSGALDTINRTLSRLGHGAVNALPSITEDERRRSVGDIFSKSLLATTIIVTAAYFFHITTFYFILKWVPKIVVDMGFAPSSAANILVSANLGGAIGGAVFGLLTLKFNVRKLSIIIMVCSAIMVAAFGQTPADLNALAWICAVTGFFTNGAVVGMYALFAHAYPTHVRAFGTGFAIGVGRGGSVLAPIIGGILFASGMGLGTVALFMACGSVLAAIALLFLRLQEEPDAA